MKKIMERGLIAYKRNSGYYQDGTSCHAARYKATIRSIHLTMRLTAAILLIGALQVSAEGSAQKISFSGTNVPLSMVFHAIEEQTGYGVLMAKSTMEAAKPVTINLTNGSLDDVLKTCFSFQPWKLQYTISGRTITISKVVENTVVEPISSEPPEISGIVRNDEGVPLSGATVEIKGLNKREQTNEKGEFVFRGVSNGTYRVEISYIGYDKYSAEVNVRDNQFQMIANLRQTGNNLDKVEVIAYGTTTQRLSTGNISTVTSKVIERQPVSNPLLALEGRVPGLFITQANGMPGSSVTVQIQGQHSIQNGNDPFYVVDGVPYSSQVLQGLSIAGGSPLSFINPSDIESISILKDADATAIYGSRAANGAILITTKKGKAGDMRVNVSAQQGVGKVTRKMHLLNTSEYLMMRHEAINNDGLTVMPTDYDLNGVWDSTRYTDWQKVLIGGTAQYSNVDASVSGGTIYTQYLVGGTYHRETTVFPGDFRDWKASVHANLSTSSTNRRFQFQLQANYLFENNILPGTDPTRSSFQLAPNAPNLFNADGSLNWALAPNGNSTWETNPIGGTHPLAGNLNKYTDKNENLISSGTISYQILDKLEFKTHLGYSKQEIDEVKTQPLISTEPALRPFTNRSAIFTYNKINSFIIEPQLAYRNNSSRIGKLEGLVGTTIQQDNTNQLQLYSTGYNTDLQLGDPRSAPTTYVVGSLDNTYKYAAVFSRINYNWNDKYLINLTGRRDGSSRFGKDNSFHNFGAIGVAWVFSKEGLFEKRLSALSYGKLRASYGTTGNDQIGDYRYLSLYAPYGQLPYQGIVSIVPQGLANPYLAWELTKKLEAGIDLGFFKDRILLNAVYVLNRTSNQLLSYLLPVITGFGGVAKNFPATVENKSWELTLNTVNIRTKDFTWSTHINLTIPRNKLVSFPNLENSSYSSTLVVGKPLNSIKVFHFLGVNDSSGVYQFADSKGNPTYNPVFGADNNVFINLTPKYYGGFENEITYKGVSLNVFFQFVKQIGPAYTLGNLYPGSIYSGNEPIYVLNRWQKPGDKAPIQRFSTDYRYIQQTNYATISDGSYSDASYIRLKNLAISWQIQNVSLKKSGIQVLKIFFAAQNLLTITSYKGLDPEAPAAWNASLPPLRVYTVGVNATF